MGPAGVDGRPANLYMPDNAILVHHEGCAVGKALLFIKDAISFGNRALEVAEEREPEPFLLRERSVRRRAVDANT